RGSGNGSVVELQDVRVFEFEQNGHLQALSVAKTATHSAGLWKLQDVRRTDFKGISADTTTAPEAEWKSNLDPNVLSVSMIHPEYLAATDLLRNIEYMQRN